MDTSIKVTYKTDIFARPEKCLFQQMLKCKTVLLLSSLQLLFLVAIVSIHRLHSWFSNYQQVFLQYEANSSICGRRASEKFSELQTPFSLPMLHTSGSRSSVQPRVTDKRNMRKYYIIYLRKELAR